MITIPCLVGPTGVGKTEIGIAVAKKLNLEIISADSRQIYRFMDIGTAKPPREAFSRIHMIDIVTPDQGYSAGDYARDARKLIEELQKAKKRCLVVGGCGLYIRALFKPFAEIPKDPKVREKLKTESQANLYAELLRIDPESAARIHAHDHQRTVRALEVYHITGTPFSSLLKNQPESPFIPSYIGITMPRKELNIKIENRFDKMLSSGLLEEVKNLKSLGYTRDLFAFNALGYRELFDYIEGRLSFERAVKEAKQKTKEYAKRQLTWFRHLEGVKWLELQDREDTVQRVIELISDSEFNQK